MSVFLTEDSLKAGEIHLNVCAKMQLIQTYKFSNEVLFLKQVNFLQGH